MPRLLAELHEEAKAIWWYHSIDLGAGFWTAGHITPEHMAVREAICQFPADLSGKSVLDIGCADGGWSVAAMRRGACQVVSIDEQMTSGIQFLLKNEVFPFEYKKMDMFSLEFGAMPTFDVVIFTGVLYHVENPLLALRVLRSKVRELVIMETHINESLGATVPYMVYYENDELGKDATNWWGPNSLCLEAMFRTAGFSFTHLHTATESPSNSRICYHLKPVDAQTESDLDG